MIDLTFSKVVISNEYPVSEFAPQIEEGMALVSIMENGRAVVTPASGVAGEVFAGIAFGYFTSPTTAPVVDVITANATTGIAVLSQVPNATNNVKVYLANTDTTSGKVYPGTMLTMTTAGAAPTANQFSLVGNVVTVASQNYGAQLYIVYRHNLSAQQAAALVGDGITSTLAAEVSQTIGVIKRGRIPTSNFDNSVDWTAVPVAITTGPNGTFTIAGTGGAVSGNVDALPTADSPFLGIEFAAN